MAGRIDGFAGSTPEYISYLEEEVIRLRQKRPTSERRSGRPRSSRHTHGSPANPLEFRHHDPIEPDRCRRNEPWKVKAARLVEETPRAVEWSTRIKEANIYTIMVDDRAAAFLLDENCSMSTLCIEQDAPQQIQGIAGRVQQYARSAIMRGVNAHLASRVANFQTFLLFSACAVLRKEQMLPQRTIQDIMKISLGNDVSDRYCMRILDTAVYLNRLIDSLNAHGWVNRATELILLWDKKPAFFFLLSCSADSSIEFLKESLTTADFMMEEAQQLWTPLFVPMLVKQILGGEIHVSIISHALGYKHANELSAVNPLQVMRHKHS